QSRARAHDGLDSVSKIAEEVRVGISVQDWELLPGIGCSRNFSHVKNYQEFDINYFQDEDGMFTAEVPAIRGCVAWGNTLREAYRNAIDAIESCLEAREMVAAKKIRKPRYAGLNIYRRPVHA